MTVVEFVTLNEYPDYEILNQYPFTIRRIDNHYVVKEKINKSNGYVSVNLNANKIAKHRIIAKQFISNDDPENKTQIDHINKDRTDYHIENLRWVSSSQNNRNVSSRNRVTYEFIDNIPDESIIITHYQTKNEYHEFDEGEYYYYHDDESDENIFYQKITDTEYRIMHINTIKGDYKCIMTRDINRKKVTIYIHTFKYQYGLV